MVPPYLYIFGWVKRVALTYRLPSYCTSDGIITQNTGRSQQHYTTLECLLAQLTSQHGSNHTALRVTSYANLPKSAISLHPVIHVAGIFYFVGNGHLNEIAFALAMSIEVKADAGNALCLQLLCNSTFQSSVPVARKPMA